MAQSFSNNFLRIGPVLVDRDYVNLAAQLPVRSMREAMSAELGERLDKPGLQQWRRRDRLRLTDPLGAPRVLYFKRFIQPPVKEQVARVLSGCPRHSTAWVEWDNIHRLGVLGVPTMRAVLFGEKMLGAWEQASLLCTEQVPGESLEKWLPTQWQPAVARHGFAWRNGVIEQLAGIVQRLHHGRLCHRDLYTSHIFVDVGEDGQTDFRLIDLQRMIRMRFRKRRWQVKDLAALAASAPAGLISKTDRMRFLLVYLREHRAGKSAKRWWRDVQAKAARMMRHHEARMKRLTK